MTSEAPLRLPVIDFSKELKPDTLEWESVKTQVRKALEYYGGFEANFYKIPMDIRKSMFSVMEEFFDLPMETKRKVPTESLNYGYIEPNAVLPLYESLGIDEANIVDMVELMAKAVWPEGNPHFCETVLSYTNNLSELDQIIRKMIVESLGIKGYIEEHMNSSKYLLRLLKYMVPKSTKTEQVLPPHGDTNIVTILHQNEVEALEVETKAGEWIRFKPTFQNSFLVIIGDAIDAWTNGRFHRPLHRVIMSGNDIRYAVGLFSFFKTGYVIKAPKELIDEEHPLLFQPYEHNKYIEFLKKWTTDVEYIKKITTEKVEKSKLKIYCGVSSDT